MIWWRKLMLFFIYRIIIPYPKRTIFYYFGRTRLWPYSFSTLLVWANFQSRSLFLIVLTFSDLLSLSHSVTCYQFLLLLVYKLWADSVLFLCPHTTTGRRCSRRRHTLSLSSVALSPASERFLRPNPMPFPSRVRRRSKGMTKRMVFRETEAKNMKKKKKEKEFLEYEFPDRNISPFPRPSF